MLQGNPVERVEHPLGPLHPALPADHFFRGFRVADSQDPDYLDEARADAEDNGDLLMQARSLALADFECSHGKLPGDPQMCECWLAEGEQLPYDLAALILLRGLSRAEAIAQLLAERPNNPEIVGSADTASAA